MQLDEREIKGISLRFVHISADGAGLEEREFCSQTDDQAEGEEDEEEEEEEGAAQKQNIPKCCRRKFS